ncbi:MAG: histidine kinase N-terminal 7TM domain-containing protein [Myxococcota bacterium]|nr:histidine kinase N-terminal 7TM domain-containing protein [Myxococcota bacterium]
MPDWEVATALGIALLVALTTHVFYRRPPVQLWPALPLVFGSALVFSIGDLVAIRWASNDSIRWAGMVMVYTGLLTIAPGWWLFTRNFSEMYGFERVAFRSGLRGLVIVDALLWIGLVTNPLHGQFLEAHEAARSTYGPLWYATAIINYAALIAAMWVHLKASFYVKDPVIRSQCRFLVAAVVIPLIMNMGYVFSPEPLSYDPTALGFALSCTLFLFAVERRDLFVLERVSLPSVLNHDADAILIITGRFRLLFANPAAGTLFGPDQLVPGSAVDELLGRAMPAFSLEDAGRNPADSAAAEHRFMSPAGEEYWVIVEVSSVQRARGVPAGLCLRLRDQTALRAARREAEENLALLKALDISTGEGILVQDEHGGIRYVNDAFGRLWKASGEQVLHWGTSLSGEVAKHLAEPFPEGLERLWHCEKGAGQRDQREGTDIQLLDGRIFEVETFPITTEHGFMGRAWRFSDVTQVRHESQAMIQSQKLEGLGVLAGGIAHDFNNLLVAILGNAEIAREDLPPNSPAHEPLADVEAAAASASDLTGQLLAYAGKTAFTREEIDLSVLVREVTSLLSVSIPKNIGLEFNLRQELPSVLGGGAELRQVVMNLVTNAADAIGDDGGKIVVETGVGNPARMPGAEATVEHGEFCDPAVHLRIADNGLGMDPRTLERIFDPFFTTKFTGRGLGLAATRGILKSHDGLLRIETALGVGSAFTVLLPSDRVVDAPEAERRRAEDTPGFGGRTVLVVDDEPSVRSVLSKRLQGAGFGVLTASSGEEALTLLEQGEAGSVDLVILDITMPGLSGIETHARLRSAYPGLPVLLSSGYPEEALATLERGDPRLDAFIQKPYRNAVLFAQIERLLGPGRE